MINDADNLNALGLLNPEDRDLQPVVVPDEEHEFVYAKNYLQQASSVTGENLYDHLTEVLNKILAERPHNIVDFFEEYSRKMKERRFRPLTDRLEDVFVPPGRLKLARNLLPLLKPLAPEEPSTVDPADLELADMSKNNMMELLYYFENSGIGLPRTEMFCLTMSLRQLIRQEPIAKIKFWGKIFGVRNNYLIVETELKDEEYIKRNEEYATLAANKLETLELPPLDKPKEVDGEDVLAHLWPELPPVPQPQYEEPPEPPVEPAGVGLNKKVYYVCHQIGGPWVQLPDVTPQQIRVSREIYKPLSGDLDQPIIAYPYFPGTERNYLRTQIARISASTHIAPLGYYRASGTGAGEGEGFDEAPPDGGDPGDIIENVKYEPVPIKDLTDRSMMFWVHYSPYILKQGRTTWWNPNPVPEALDEELGGEDEDKRPVIAGVEPEAGPPLLTPCSEDVTLDAIPAWAVQSSSNITEEFALCIVRNNFWPGAYSFATQGKTFHNVYFGTGLKLKVPNFSPKPLPPVEQDYPIGPEILEMLDPTGAEEEAWRIAHLPKEPPTKLVGGEEIPEEEEEEDEEDDD